jgi:dihydroorotase
MECAEVDPEEKNNAPSLTIARPDDFHHHLRDGDVLGDTAVAAARQFGRALVMPNLVPPVTTAEAATAYKARILDTLHARGCKTGFQPLMTLYLTDDTSPEEIKRAAAAGDVKAVKLYPAGATTNSASGVTDYSRLTGALQAMAHYGLPLCVHGEVTEPTVDIFDRERVFVQTRLPELLQRASQLKVVLEHMTTKEAADFVLSAGPNVGATITPQHLLANRNHMLVGGIKPHLYCLPILKTEADRQALLKAATSGCDRIFLGTDSAPHAIGAKESACGCAGVFSSHAAIEFYATAFEEAGALDKLEGFASRHGAQFYGLEPSNEMVTLHRENWTLPARLPFGQSEVVPFQAGRTLNWRLSAADTY